MLPMKCPGNDNKIQAAIRKEKKTLIQGVVYKWRHVLTHLFLLLRVFFNENHLFLINLTPSPPPNNTMSIIDNYTKMFILETSGSQPLCLDAQVCRLIFLDVSPNLKMSKKVCINSYIFIISDSFLHFENRYALLGLYS
jgi:hypothetical protein